MGGCGSPNRWLRFAGGMLWWEGLRAGRWLGGQLLISCGVDGCNCLCKGGGPAGWMAARSMEAAVAPVSPAGLLSQALEGEGGATVIYLASLSLSEMLCRPVGALPVTIKAHVSLRRPAGGQVFGRTGLSLHFADGRTMKHHCQQTQTNPSKTIISRSHVSL